MSRISDYLGEGKAVNLGGYFRIQPYLTGNVNETGVLTQKNKLAVRITALAKLKMRLSSFAWRLKGDRVKRLQGKPAMGMDYTQCTTSIQEASNLSCVRTSSRFSRGGLLIRNLSRFSGTLVMIVN